MIGVAIIILLIFLILWIWLLVWASSKKGVLGFVLVFFLPIVGSIIVALLPDDEEEEQKKKNFYCNICHIKYREEMLGGETDYEGVICKYCLEKKLKEKP